MARVLRDLAAVGPYFAVGWRDTPPGPPWRPVAELYRPDVVALPVETTARVLGGAPPRVAASLFQQGYAARLWSVFLGAAVTARVLLDLPADRLWWRGTDRAPVELLAVAAEGIPVEGTPEAAVAARIDTAVRPGHLDALCGAVRSAFGLSSLVMAGNTASALVGTARVLAGHGDAVALAGALLRRPGLAEAGTVPADLRTSDYRRASCCLYYRLPGGGLCGDCVLRRARSRQGG